MNHFEQLAETQVSSPVKARQKAAEARSERAKQADRQLEEDAQLLRLYRTHQRRDVRALLEGPFGKDVRGLMKVLRTMTLESGPALLKIVRSSAWLKEMPVEQRWIVLRLVSRAIIRVREAAGLQPFDDGLPGDPPKAFEQIREELGLR
jgi:hypothetical protein